MRHCSALAGNECAGRVNAAVPLRDRVVTVHPVITLDARCVVGQMIGLFDKQRRRPQRVVVGPHAAGTQAVAVDAAGAAKQGSETDEQQEL
jgi:hypothetical protein